MHYVSVAAAAAHLGVSERTIRRYIAGGYLVAARVGPRLTRIALADVDALARPLPAAEPVDA